MSGQVDPTAPKSLGDPAEVIRRLATAESATHVKALRDLAREIAIERGAAVPEPDPLDGGSKARALLLLETPGPTIRRTGFVSRDNPTGTAANLFRFAEEARLHRRDTVIWNAVPWVIHAEGASNRAPRRSELLDAQPYLARLIDCLPYLKVVVLAGRMAGELTPSIAERFPVIPIVRVPHPSPTYVCTSPDVRRRIIAGLAQAAAILASEPPGSSPVRWDGECPSLAFGRQTS
ncbi:MAG: uracil-DNA glycosylase [Methylobacterium sp.]|uniref:uracil-DNA glycosylase n=1 Tax=Methylobacterium sp. TaxID=409 RepID=UPI0025F54DE6|nr:uracil-DNA glycosylase [Methylobacterium sp.]MBX9933392.1 uracil-DNA glycosylase [Methylobacterium sp.]